MRLDFFNQKINIIMNKNFNFKINFNEGIPLCKKSYFLIFLFFFSMQLSAQDLTRIHTCNIYLITELENLQSNDFVKWMLLPEYINANQFAQANTISQLLTANDADEEQALLYYNTLIGAGLDGRWAHQLNDIELNKIRTIAATEAPIHHNAKALLHFYYHEFLERPSYEFNQLRIAKKNTESKAKENIVAKEKVLMLYPNPANDKVFIELNNTQADSKIKITITNVFGQIVRVEEFVNTNNGKFEIDTKNLTNGIYSIQIISNTILVDTKKVVIN
jgi:hypothetical protein